MANIVLVAGTHHGGWYWDPIADQLRKLGHNIFAPTLSGLDDSTPFSGLANLDTHIDDVLLVISENYLDPVVLVGWSYGGMVITGVSDRTTAKVSNLIYLDACVPFSGQSEWDLMNPELRAQFTSSSKDGINIEVSEKFLALRPRLMPQAFATKLQPLHYSEAKFEATPKVYVNAELGFGPIGDHFFSKIYKRISGTQGWKTYSLPAGHDLATDLPDEVIKIISDNV